MSINIEPLLNGEIDEIGIDLFLTPEDVFEDVSFYEKAEIKGKVRNMAGYIELDVNAVIPYRAECSRCLKPLDRKLEISFKSPVVRKDSLENDETDEYVFYENGILDIESVISEQIILEMPSKHLCMDDCKGLCPKCGKDLNDGDCGCEKSEPDPRFDVLRKLLEK